MMKAFDIYQCFCLFFIIQIIYLFAGSAHLTLHEKTFRVNFIVLDVCFIKMELFNGIIFLTGVMLAIAYGKKHILFVNVKQIVLSCKKNIY